jgi:hypothetical protein
LSEGAYIASARANQNLQFSCCNARPILLEGYEALNQVGKGRIQERKRQLVNRAVKQKSLILFGSVLCSLLNAGVAVFAQGTAFTNQGRLRDGGSPAGGSNRFNRGKPALLVDPIIL